MKTEKYLLALKCLLTLHALAPSNPTLHSQKIRFRLAISALGSDTDPSALLPRKVSEI